LTVAELIVQLFNEQKACLENLVCSWPRKYNLLPAKVNQVLAG